MGILKVVLLTLALNIKRRKQDDMLLKVVLVQRKLSYRNLTQ